MVKTRNKQLFGLVIPILILLAVSMYFTYISLHKYLGSVNVKEHMSQSKVLLVLEGSLSNELVCAAAMSYNVCTKIRHTTDGLIDQLKKHPLEASSLSISNLENNIQNMRNDIDNNKVTVDLLIRNRYQKEIFNPIAAYVNDLKNYDSLFKEQELLAFFSQISSISHANESEKILMAYILAQETPITPDNLIYWDKVLSSSSLLSLGKEKNISLIKRESLDILKSREFIKILENLDNVRIDLLTNFKSTRFKTDIATWINLLNQKQKKLTQIKTMLVDHLSSEIDSYHKGKGFILILAIIFTLLNILFLFYFIYYYRKQVEEENALYNVANSINALSSYDNNESVAMLDVLKNAKNKKQIYSYINSSFHLLNEKEKQAVDDSAAKNIFLASMSHEVRTPLNGMMGFIKLLRETDLKSNQREFLSVIDDSSKNLLQIVNNVLDISKINADKMEPEYTAFNISEKIESVVEIFAAKADHKDIFLSVFVDPSLPQELIGDSNKLAQVITNLVSNALKFTDEYGTIDVFVTHMRETEDKIRIKFSVQDSGVGLDTEEQNKIFNVYTQADESTVRQVGGTGLGLTISHKMVEIMGGELKLKSEKGKGSNFFFALELKKNKNSIPKLYPRFDGLHVGLALPVKNISRQTDKNLKEYITYLGGTFSIYYYDDLFIYNQSMQLPDLMIVEHHYARLQGEVEDFLALDCKTVLMTTGSLHSRLSQDDHTFSRIVYAPMTMRKTIRLLTANYEKEEVSVSTKSIVQSNDEFQNLHALVVEDNSVNQKLVKIILEDLGLKVSVAYNGKEAFELCQDTVYDIIFMDIQMPVMDGIEATKRILFYENINNATHVPIVALTANVLPSDKEKYIEVGMDDCIAKPVDIEQMKEVIKKYCLSENLLKTSENFLKMIDKQ